MKKLIGIAVADPHGTHGALEATNMGENRWPTHREAHRVRGLYTGSDGFIGFGALKRGFPLQKGMPWGKKPTPTLLEAVALTNLTSTGWKLLPGPLPAVGSALLSQFCPVIGTQSLPRESAQSLDSFWLRPALRS